MRLVSYATANGSRVAVRVGDSYVDLNQADASLPSSMLDLLAAGPEALRRAASAVAGGKPLPADGLRLLAPVPRPQKVICVGLNYADHARNRPDPAAGTRHLLQVRHGGFGT